MAPPKDLVNEIKHLIPPLDGSLHKGQSGRVGVLGGARDYTGAPFFASMSSMRLGADMAHVICSPTAAGAMKAYSPDLIVHPILREDASEDAVKEELQGLFSRLHVLVMGPGLGREDYMQKYAHMALGIARERGMYIVCDADALWMVGKHPEAVKGYRRAILTPNVMEFKRLAEAVNVPSDAPPRERAGMISKALGGVLVVQKGPTDLIAFDTTGDAADAQASKVPEGQGEARADIVEIDIEGGLKRCGGQGDVLSGTIGAFLAWGKCLEDGAFGDKSKIVTSRIPLLAAAAGSMVTRSASRRAFAKEGRSVVTQDMLSEVGNAFADVFGDENQGRTAKSKY